jgi:putative ATP-grasp target RiPP
MLTASRHQFPLDPAPVPSTPPLNGADPSVPFGLKYAAIPTSGAIAVDSGDITYDAAWQVSVITGEDGAKILAKGRHTSDQTTTSTASNDRESNDSDTDAGGS